MSLSIEDRLCYITLLCLAASSDEPGVIQECTEEGVIKLTHLVDNPYDSDNEYTRAVGCLKRFSDKGMIECDACDAGYEKTYTIRIKNFFKRQEEYSTSAERMRRKRAKDKEISDVTLDVTGVTSHCDARIEENRRERIQKISGEISSLLKEDTKQAPTLEEYINEVAEQEFIDDEMVYRRDGKLVSVKTLEKEYSKRYPAPSVRPHKPRSTTFRYDYDTYLTSLQNSSKKVEKIIAFVWKERGYRFENYEQWRQRMGQDVKYARELEGYRPEQVQKVIDDLNKEERELHYKWSMSTIAKRIANVTV